MHQAETGARFHIILVPFKVRLFLKDRIWGRNELGVRSCSKGPGYTLFPVRFSEGRQLLFPVHQTPLEE